MLFYFQNRNNQTHLHQRGTSIHVLGVGIVLHLPRENYSVNRTICILHSILSDSSVNTSTYYN